MACCYFVNLFVFNQIRRRLPTCLGSWRGSVLAAALGIIFAKVAVMPDHTRVAAVSL